MSDYVLKYSSFQAPARSSADRPSTFQGSSAQPVAAAQAPKTNPMISPQELMRLAERDFNSAEDVRNHAQQRVREFDQQWGMAPDAEDDFTPMTR